MKVFVDYFKTVFSTSWPSELEQVFQAMDSKVLEVNNSKLIQKFRHEEIKACLDQMHSDKALGPDGMTGFL